MECTDVSGVACGTKMSQKDIFVFSVELAAWENPKSRKYNTESAISNYLGFKLQKDKNWAVVSTRLLGLTIFLGGERYLESNSF